MVKSRRVAKRFPSNAGPIVAGNELSSPNTRMKPALARDWSLCAAVNPAFARTGWLSLARALALSWGISGTVSLLRVQNVAAAAGRPLLQLALEGLGVIGFVASLALLGGRDTDAGRTLNLIRRLEGLPAHESRYHALISLRQSSYLLLLPALSFALAARATPGQSAIWHGLLLLVGCATFACVLGAAFALAIWIARAVNAEHARKILVGLVAAPLLLHGVWPELASPLQLLRQFAVLCVSVSA